MIVVLYHYRHQHLADWALIVLDISGRKKGGFWSQLISRTKDYEAETKSEETTQ